MVKKFEEIEHSGTVPNRWNSLGAQKTKSAARREATRKKAAAVETNRSTLATNEEELKNLSERRRQSLDRKHAIDSRLDEITAEMNQRNPHEHSERLRDELAQLRDEHKGGVEGRKLWNERIKELKVMIRELKSNELAGVRGRDSRPSTPRKGKFLV